jgi:hypothetical protein
VWTVTGYQYTLIKYVHNDASGECVNVGLAFLAPDERLLRVKFNQRYRRISQFFLDAFDGDHYRNMVRALTDHLDRVADALRSQADCLAPFKDLPDELAKIMETALLEDSTAFRWGPICGGVTADIEGRFNRLFADFITRHDKPMTRPLRQESQMWGDFERLVRQRNLDLSLKPFTLSSDVYRYEFHGSFQNGKPNVIEPISLDLFGGSSIVEKANQWTGRLLALRLNQDFAFHAIMAPPSDESLRPYFDRARRLLSSQKDVVRHLIVQKEDQDQLEDLFREIDAAEPG